MDPLERSESISKEFKENREKETWRRTCLLSFQSLGIVFGRLSTAPLYVFGSIHPGDFKSEKEIYELFSFIFWSLSIIPLLKYAFIVLRADDDGEGGTFPLYSLLCRYANVGLLPNDNSASEIMNHDSESDRIKVRTRARRALERHKIFHNLLFFLALFGCCMIIADGVLTPSVSVLSATSTFGRSMIKLSHRVFSSPKTRNQADKIFSKIPVPMSCAILVCLFSVQRFGTKKVGFLFAPIIIVWLTFISGIGVYNIVKDPKILHAISPIYMFRFFKRVDLRSWKLLGSIVLCVAGSEAMFTNLGHFSMKSIKLTFICLVYPALILSYAGQAASIARHLGTSDDVANLSEYVPDKTLHHAFAIVSIFASAVGSQATITASFSIINQCQSLSCFPRVKVIHTSDEIRGQVYIPDVNWLFMALSIGITVGFRSITPIGTATGLAIISGMLVTTCLMSLVISLPWERSLILSTCFLLFFGSLEAMYLSSSLLNFPRGAWFLLVLSVIFLTIMISWHYGTLKKYQFDVENKVSVDWLTDLSPGLGISRVHGIGFIHTNIVSGIPAFFSHFITNLPAFHEVLIFVCFKSLPIPYISNDQRYLIGRVGPKEYKIYRCVVLHGYRDNIRDCDDFEDHIVSSIGEFIAREVRDHEALTSPEGMMVLGRTMGRGSALIPMTISSTSDQTFVGNTTKSILSCDLAETSSAPALRKRVRFTLPEKSPQQDDSVRQELQHLVDARESGTAYFLGKSHLSVRRGSNLLKRFLVMIYIFLDQNCREPPVALNIPHAALLEVGMAYTI
ncbi:OLC1v1013756C1 [Oldenlandia corymbosa var. corymbosa]|uniref:Potassium transporter n=1 Tax=Oldenlandia corymbosa var. corymbosa TaxID=529605 RepID=A0AAV1E176_OLDCO|nr:OLC1v1013756C1 [Oldenlandia corymbosa var. corymbosa]